MDETEQLQYRKTRCKFNPILDHLSSIAVLLYIRIYIYICVYDCVIPISLNFVPFLFHSYCIHYTYRYTYLYTKLKYGRITRSRWKQAEEDEEEKKRKKKLYISMSKWILLMVRFDMIGNCVKEKKLFHLNNFLHVIICIIEDGWYTWCDDGVLCDDMVVWFWYISAYIYLMVDDFFMVMILVIELLVVEIYCQSTLST